MGPSGSGKSTLMHILAGLDRPTLDRRPRRRRDHEAQRQEADAAPARAHRLRLPVLQPAADADRRGERPPPARDRRPQGRPRVARRAARDGRDRRAARHKPVRCRAANSSGSRSRGRSCPKRGAVRGRADGQPRLRHLEGAPCPPPLRRRARPDDRHGHARRERGGDGRPHPLHRRRPHRQGRPRDDGRRGDRRDAGVTGRDARRTQGNPRPQAADGPDRVLDRPRRLDGDGQLRPHRHDVEGVRLDLQRAVRRRPTPSSAAARSSTGPTRAMRS